MEIVRAKKLPNETRFEQCRVASQMDVQSYDLRNNYVNSYTSFLPYTHDLVTNDDGEYYKLNPDKADEFIYELMTILDELYICKHREPISPKQALFYRAFFYLVIRLTTLSVDDRNPENVTFNEFRLYARESTTDLTRSEFENRYAALKFDDSPFYLISGMLGKINDSLIVVERNGFFLPDNPTVVNESEKRMNDYISMFYEDDLEDMEWGRASYISYLTNVIETDENGMLIDQDVFEMAVMDYYKGLFKYANITFVNNVIDAIDVFLIRNGLTIFSDKEKFEKVFSKIDSCLKTLRTFNKQKGKVIS